MCFTLSMEKINNKKTVADSLNMHFPYENFLRILSFDHELIFVVFFLKFLVILAN